jgi:AcrR family transcriptional regulator
VFAEMGYGASTVRDIIRRTDLATGTFYNYFESKEEVFKALSVNMGEDLRAQLSDVRARADSFAEFIEGSFHIYFSYYANNPLDYALVRSTRGRDGVNVNMRGPQVKAGLAEMRQDIERALESGMVRNVNPAFLTAAIGGIAFSILDEVMESDTPDPQAAAAFAAQLVLTGLTEKE